MSPQIQPFARLSPAERPELFKMERDAEPAPRSVVLFLQFPATLPWFDGHFPGRPLLPGVAQVHLAGIASQAVFTFDSAYRGTGRLKFVRPITPEVPVQLTLQLKTSSVRFEYRRDDVVCASGSLLFTQ